MNIIRVGKVVENYTRISILLLIDSVKHSIIDRLCKISIYPYICGQSDIGTHVDDLDNASAVPLSVTNFREYPSDRNPVCFSERVYIHEH